MNGSTGGAAAAWTDGIRRVNRAPALLLGVWVMTLFISVPLTLVLRDMLARHLGGSLAAETAASGVNYDWMQEFSDQASGIGVTFRPTIIGFGAVLDNLSAFLDDTSRPLVIAAAASVYMGLWIFVAGGIIDRYARDRAIGAHGFFAACGVFVTRFLRLAVVQWAVYAVLFGAVHRYLFADLFRDLTRETTVERSAFFLRLALYAVFGLLVAAVNIVFDYAKVRAVVEDRRSMASALAGAMRFVRGNGAAAALYALDVATFVAAVAAYGVVAPGAGGSGAMMWIGAAIGQLYVLARLWIKLLFWASATALFQARLAHAGYIAAAPAVWPESPSAEAITPPAQ